MNDLAGATNAPMRMTAMILVAVGAVTVVAMRGCSSLQKRGARSAYAKYQSAQTDFRDKWADKRADLESEQRELNEKISERRSNWRKDKKSFREIQDGLQDLTKRLSEVSKEIGKLRSEEQKERAELQSGKWRTLRKSYRSRISGTATWGYVQQWILIPGVAVLFVGLLLLAKFGSKTESMLGLVMIGVILYSLFVGGELWADSPIDSMWMFSRGI